MTRYYFYYYYSKISYEGIVIERNNSKHWFISTEIPVRRYYYDSIIRALKNFVFVDRIRKTSGFGEFAYIDLTDSEIMYLKLCEP